MPVFSDAEYRHKLNRPRLQEVWERLPTVLRIDGLKVRWIGPLIELGHDVWVGDLSNAAWGYLEVCGWTSVFEQAGAMLDDTGELRAEWAAAFGRAARLLAEEGGCGGPESDAERWASWIAFELSEPHRYVKALAEAKGWDK